MTTFLRNNRWSILWGLFILILTLMPGDAIPRVPVWIDRLHPDKLIHLFIFAVFVFLLIGGFDRSGNPGFVRNYAVFWAVAISLFIGGATELLQGWVIPMRTADWKDFFADAAGTLGVVIALWAHRFLLSED
ncbi:MAG: VanZ family protein [Bacteroidetes bacterium]|nr:VanZ family protein [Bacteroidota bacterium]